MHYVYILKTKSDTTYVGCTSNLKDRLHRHKSGHVPVTKPNLPIKLVSYFAFTDKYLAYNFERYLKTASGRAFMAKRLV